MDRMFWVKAEDIGPLKKDATSASDAALDTKTLPSFVSSLKVYRISWVNHDKFFFYNPISHPKIAGTLTNRPSSNILYGKSAINSPSMAGVNGNSAALVCPGKAIGALAVCKTVVSLFRRHSKGFPVPLHPALEVNKSNCHSSSDTRIWVGKKRAKPQRHLRRV